MRYTRMTCDHQYYCRCKRLTRRQRSNAKERAEYSAENSRDVLDRTAVRQSSPKHAAICRRSRLHRSSVVRKGVQRQALPKSRCGQEGYGRAGLPRSFRYRLQTSEVAARDLPSEPMTTSSSGLCPRPRKCAASDLPGPLGPTNSQAPSPSIADRRSIGRGQIRLRLWQTGRS